MGAQIQKTATTNSFIGLEQTFAAVDESVSIGALQELVQTVVVSMLRRGEDSSLRERTLATISAYFLHMRGVQGLEAKAKLAQLIPNVKVFDSDSPKTALIAGDVDLGVTWTGEAFIAHQEKPSLSYVYPKEAAILWQDNWAMLKGASHADAAYAWMNYLLQGDVFWLTIRDFPYINPNTAALEYAKTNQPDVYKAYFDSPITNPPAEAIKNGHGIKDVGDATPLYDAIWVEVKGSN